jgi:hypothetical protein
MQNAILTISPRDDWDCRNVTFARLAATPFTYLHITTANQAAFTPHCKALTRRP